MSELTMTTASYYHPSVDFVQTVIYPILDCVATGVLESSSKRVTFLFGPIILKELKIKR